MTPKTKAGLIKTLWYVLGIAAFVVLMLPLFWMFMASFMTKHEIFHNPPYFLPPNPSLNAYRQLFSFSYGLPGLFRNSIIVALGCMVISVVLSVPAAYSLAKRNIRGKGLILLLFLISQMLPEIFTLVPYLGIFSKIGIYNTYWAPILACCTLAIPFCVIMMRPYFKGVSKEIEDAALIDGATYWQAFTRIMLPIASPGVALSFVFSFLFAYGDMMYSLNLIGDGELWPVTTGIYNLVGRHGIAWDQAMAFATLVILPVLIIFLLMQRYIVEGLTSGSVKG